MLNNQKILDQYEAFLDIETLDPALVAGFVSMALPARKTKPLDINRYTEGSTDPTYKSKIPEPPILRMPSRLTRRYVPLRLEIAPRQHADSPFLITNAAIGTTQEITKQSIYFHDTETKTETVKLPGADTKSQLVIESKSNIYERNNVVHETERRHEIIKELRSQHEKTIAQNQQTHHHTETTITEDREYESVLIDEVPGLPTVNNIVTEHGPLVINETQSSQSDITQIQNITEVFGYNEYLPSSTRQILLQKQTDNIQLGSAISIPFVMSNIVVQRKDSESLLVSSSKTEFKNVKEETAHNGEENKQVESRVNKSQALSTEASAETIIIDQTQQSENTITQINTDDLDSTTIINSPAQDPILNPKTQTAADHNISDSVSKPYQHAQGTEAQVIIKDNVSETTIKIPGEKSIETIFQSKKETVEAQDNISTSSAPKVSNELDPVVSTEEVDSGIETRFVINEIDNSHRTVVTKHESIFVTQPTGKKQLSQSDDVKTGKKSDQTVSKDGIITIEETTGSQSQIEDTLLTSDVVQEVSKIEMPYDKTSEIVFEDNDDDTTTVHQKIKVIKPKQKTQTHGEVLISDTVQKPAFSDDFMPFEMPSTTSFSEAQPVENTAYNTGQVFIEDVVKNYSYVRNDRNEIDFLIDDATAPHTTQERKEAIARVQKQIENMIHTEVQSGRINIHKLELTENVIKTQQERDSIVREIVSKTKDILDVPIHDLQLEQALLKQKFEAQFERKLLEALRKAQEEWAASTKKMLVNLLEDIMRS